MELSLSLAVTRPATASDGATYTVTMTGLDGSTARVGDHASIGFTTDPVGGVITQKWGSTLGGSQYGTGANPTDFTAGDGGTLYLEVTRDGEVVNASAPILYYAPVLASAIPDTIFYGLTGNSTVDLSTYLTGTGITYSIVVNGAPAPSGWSLDTGTGVVTIDKATTGTFAAATVVATATNSGGSANDTFTIAVEASSAFTVVTDSGGNIVFTGDNTNGDITIEVTAADDANHVQVYSAFDSALLDTGPVNLFTATDSGSTVLGENRVKVSDGLWISDTVDTPAGPTIDRHRERDGVDISGTANGAGDTYTIVADDLGTNHNISEDATDNNGTRSQDSIVAAIPNNFTPTTLGAKLLLWIDPSDLSTLYVNNNYTTNVTANGQNLGSLVSKDTNGYQFTSRTTSPARDWTSPPVYNTDGTYHWVTYAAATGIGADEAITLGTDVRVFSVIETTDTAIVLAGAEGNSSSWVGLGQSGNTSSPSGNCGTPTYHVNDGAALSPSQRRILYDNFCTGVALIAEGRGANLSATGGWEAADGFLPMLYNTRSLALDFDGKMYSYIVTTNDLTTQENNDLIQWLKDQAGIV